MIAAIKGAGLGETVALVTDGRCSGATPRGPILRRIVLRKVFAFDRQFNEQGFEVSPAKAAGS